MLQRYIHIVCALIVILLFGIANKSYSNPNLKVNAEQIFSNPNEVKAICKDARGALWLGTVSGLDIYDGYEIINIQELQNTRIFKMAYDAVTDRIWAATEKGVYQIECRSLRINKIYDSLINGDLITDISFNDRNRFLYCASSTGIFYIVDLKGHLQIVINTHLNLRQFVTISNGDIFLFDNKSIFRLQIKSNKLSKIFYSKSNRLIPNGLDKVGDTVLISTWYHGEQIIDGKTLDILTPKIINNINDTNNRASVATLKDGILFTAFSNYSFYISDLKNNTQQNISKEFGKIFNGKYYNCIFAVNDQTVFVGTSNGLIKISIQKKLFNQILSGNIPTISTRSILETNEGLFVASYSGIFQHNNQNNKWENIINIKNAIDQTILPYAMLDDGKYIYSVLESYILYRCDKKSLIVTKKFYKKSDDSLSSGFCLTKDNSGKIWIGTSNGIASYDTVTNTLDFHRKDRFHLDGATVRSLFFDSNNRQLFAATSKGVFSISINKNTSKLIWKENKKNNNNNLLFATLDSKNNIWVGTKGDGIYIINTKTNNVKHLTQDDGLSDNLVYCILFDNDKSAWISTFNGLSNYKIDKNIFNNYYEEDGLSNNEFNHNSYLIDNTGKFYFGGVDGINTFYPSELNHNEEKFDIFISGIKKWDIKNGNEITTPTNNQTEFTKTPSEVALGIMLGSSDYKHQEKTIFLYKINGLNASWVRLKNPHVLRLDGLPYGKYNVSIKALNYRGQVSNNTLHITIELEAPYYYRWWFIVLIILIIALLTYGIFKYKIAELKKYQELRVQIASDLHDEVGSILTSIGMYSENLRNSKESTVKKENKIDKIASLSRNAIRSMRDILWAIDARNDLTNNFVEHLRNHAEEMLLPKNINIHFELKIDAAQKQLEGNIRHHLYFIIKEAINNIAKHSNATDVYIKFILNREHLNIRISNNGIIMKKDDRKGQGLKNMKLRAEKIKAKFSYATSDDEFVIMIIR